MQMYYNITERVNAESHKPITSPFYPVPPAFKSFKKIRGIVKMYRFSAMFGSFYSVHPTCTVSVHSCPKLVQ